MRGFAFVLAFALAAQLELLLLQRPLLRLQQQLLSLLPVLQVLHTIAAAAACCCVLLLLLLLRLLLQVAAVAEDALAVGDATLGRVSSNSDVYIVQ